jgi:hypothetical protein
MTSSLNSWQAEMLHHATTHAIRESLERIGKRGLPGGLKLTDPSQRERARRLRDILVDYQRRGACDVDSSLTALAACRELENLVDDLRTAGKRPC